MTPGMAKVNRACCKYPGCKLTRIVETFWAGTEDEYCSYGQWCAVHCRQYAEEATAQGGAKVIRIK